MAFKGHYKIITAMAWFDRLCIWLPISVS